MLIQHPRNTCVVWSFCLSAVLDGIDFPCIKSATTREGGPKACSCRASSKNQGTYEAAVVLASFETHFRPNSRGLSKLLFQNNLHPTHTHSCFRSDKALHCLVIGGRSHQPSKAYLVTLHARERGSPKSSRTARQARPDL